ncbi:MAG: phosphoribosylformylglycinamidine cyclo-ligase [Spirochaetales bacterium]|nr:phosphoribosylformylglycinamidine cyclo-ligase [Spirochaetales bacterium]
MISYKDSGVDKEEGYKAVDKIKEAVSRTHGLGVLAGLGSFGSLFELPSNVKNPVLVSGTDGVGTKLEVAFAVKNYDTVGQDCFAMCANDILCHGAKPLFFLDYLACGKLDSEVSSRLVTGIAHACEEAGCALVGGETAEMPGFYKDGDYDMAGFCVGVVDKEKIINGSTIEKGDVIIGLPSNGLHSNGFSLTRKVLPDYNMDFNGAPLHEELLKPTKVYVTQVLELLGGFNIKGMAHITGGGLIENVPRIMPEGLCAQITKNSFPKQAIFDLIASKGVPEEEMWGTYNMGIGYTIVVPADQAKALQQVLESAGEPSYLIGEIVKGKEKVCLV